MILSKLVDFVMTFCNQLGGVNNHVPLSIVCVGFFCLCLFGTIFKLICRIKSFAFFGG